MDSHGAIPLQDNPRFSTETQRMNGYRQSTLPDRADRILEDLQNGKNLPLVEQLQKSSRSHNSVSRAGNFKSLALNAICIESINLTSRRESVWSCSQCHNIWHFRCARTWANEFLRTATLTAAWKCPGCLAYQPEILEARCWCRKKKHSSDVTVNGTGNSCGGSCNKIKTCPHGQTVMCNRFCHPGPCNLPCPAVCPTGPVKVRQPGAWEKACGRMRSREPKSVTRTLVLLVLLVVVYGILTGFIVLCMRWWTMPYAYPGWLTKWSHTIQVIQLLGGVFVVVPLVGSLWLCFLPNLKYLLLLFFNLSSSQDRGIRGNYSIERKRLLLEGILGLTCAAGVAFPIFGFAGLPDVAWYNQMKDSCEGYSTRILIETYVSGSRHRAVAGSMLSKFGFESVSAGVPTKNFYLSPHLEPMFNEVKDFQYYHRLSGQLQNGTFIAVDVDSEKNLWRVKHLSRNDEANKWESYDSSRPRPEDATTLFRPVPIFVPHEERLVMNGTIGTFSETRKHMFIPDLGFVIQNMHDYIHGCELDPFMRIFNTDTIHDMGWDVQAVLKETWNGKGKKDKLYPAIDMRTASFGHGSQAITLCGKEKHESSGGNKALNGEEAVDAKSGMREDLLVPFAILTSFHERSLQNSLRLSSARCGRSKDE